MDGQMMKGPLAASGSALAGIAASACCIGPLVLSLLGVSGAAFAQRFEPLRPYFLVATYALLGAAFYLTYGPAKAACGPGSRRKLRATERSATASPSPRTICGVRLSRPAVPRQQSASRASSMPTGARARSGTPRGAAAWATCGH